MGVWGVGHICVRKRRKRRGISHGLPAHDFTLLTLFHAGSQLRMYARTLSLCVLAGVKMHMLCAWEGLRGAAGVHYCTAGC
jgi:hypothetical protein